MALITVYIITYRRHAMLRRAIQSVLRQTLQDFRAIVVNDDPEDHGVVEIINAFADPRLSLYMPLERRGAATNFNLMFDDADAEYVALLEDDNWWESEFLETMQNLLNAYPQVDVACCNERLWQENIDHSWRDTGYNIWRDFGAGLYSFSLANICGSAMLRNSAALYRRRRGIDLRTPDDIPVDVTEHFRERLFPAGIALHSRPMANYAKTLTSARGRGPVWGQYQTLLIGSVFAALPPGAARLNLARELWATCPGPVAPRATTLILCGMVVHEARDLFWTAPWQTHSRVAMTALKRMSEFVCHRSAKRALAHHFAYLVNTPLLRQLTKTP